MFIFNLILSGLLNLHPLVYNFPLLLFSESVGIESPFLHDSHYLGTINSLG